VEELLDSGLWQVTQIPLHPDCAITAWEIPHYYGPWKNHLGVAPKYEQGGVYVPLWVFVMSMQLYPHKTSGLFNFSARGYDAAKKLYFRAVADPCIKQVIITEERIRIAANLKDYTVDFLKALNSQQKIIEEEIRKHGRS